jgi:hypothetical protein
LETIGASSATQAAKTTAVFNKVGKVAAVMAVGVAAAGVKMAGDFEQQTNVLVTAAGELPKNLGHIRDGILNIATETGTAWQQVVESVYDAEKAGFRNDDALKISTAAAQAAREENAQLSTVTDGLTRALTAYNLKGDDAVRVTNALKTGAGNAHATFEEYSAGLGSFLSRAANAKISLPDALGVYSSLTQQESAQQAGQNLGSTITHLANLNGTQRQIFGQLGINVVDFQNKLGDGPGGRGLIGSLNLLSTSALNFIGGPAKGLLNTFNQSQLAAQDANTMFAALPPAAQKIAKAFEDGSESTTAWRKDSRALGGETSILAQQWYTAYGKAHGFQDALKQGGPVAQNYLGLMKKLTGGQEGLTVALAASGMQAGKTDDRVKAISKSFNDTTKDVEGWASTQKLFNVQFDQFKQAAERVAIEIGTKLLPPLKAMFGFLADHKTILKDLAYGAIILGGAWTAMKIDGLVRSIAAWTRGMLGLTTATQGAAAAEAELAAAGAGAAEAGAAGAAGAGAGIGAAEAGAAGAASRARFNPIKLVIPIAVTYAAVQGLGLDKSVSDIIHGDFKKAADDAPGWAKTTGVAIHNAITGQLTAISADFGQANPHAKDFWSTFVPTSAQINTFQTSLKNAADLLNSDTNALDGNTAGAISNRKGLEGLAFQAVVAANAYAKQTGNTEDFTTALALSIPQILDQAQATGLNRDQAAAFLNTVIKIPGFKITTVGLDGAEAAQQKIDAYLQALANIPSVVRTDVINYVSTIGTYQSNNPAALGLQGLMSGIPPNATGGYITGPGTGTSDSILRRLSNGEFVVNAKSTAAYRPLLEAINSKGFALGGYVGSGGPSRMMRGGGDVHVHVHAWDGASVDRWLRDGGAKTIAVEVNRATRNGMRLN